MYDRKNRSNFGDTFPTVKRSDGYGVGNSQISLRRKGCGTAMTRMGAKYVLFGKEQ